MTATDAHLAALSYAARGWRVIPIIPGKKHPGIQGWQDAATTDLAHIDHWWTVNPNHGVGIATGPTSGIFVLDVDINDGKQGDDTLADLELTYGDLPPTVECVTGTGGRHLYFRYPDGHEIRNDAGRKLGHGLDIRGDGGQVLAPPTIHPNGTPYIWEASSHPDDTDIADAPGWLIALLTLDHTATTPAPPPARGTGNLDDDSPAARYNNATTWPELLEADGWTLDHTDRDGEQYWVRPGKQARDGVSATVGWHGNDMLRVFTTSLPWLPERAYSRFGYYSCRYHHGDRSAAAKALVRAEREGHDLAAMLPADRTKPEPGQTPDPEHDPLRIINWAEFWQGDTGAADWLLEPLIARGRGHSLYAGAKSGKSLVMLAACAALATGRPFLNNPARPPVDILYLDYEMTGDDVRERLEAYGYGPDDNLDHLHYALLPTIDPLDTHSGADVVIEAAIRLNAAHVIIDTTSRAVAGEENDADTFRTLYRLLGLKLKSHGIGYHRLDHAGKDFERGQRGSSAKNDDVDVVQSLVRRDGGIVVRATHRRMSWVPETVELGIEDVDGVLTYTTPEAIYPTGTWHAVTLLEESGLPIEWGRDRIRKQFKEAGFSIPNDALTAAIKLRKARAGGSELVQKPVRDPHGQVSYPHPEDEMRTARTGSQNPRSQLRTGSTDRSGQVGQVIGPESVTLVTDRSDPTPTNPAHKALFEDDPIDTDEEDL